MTTKAATHSAPRMSDAAVAAKTGKNWKQWFAILDKVGGKRMTHQEIVKYLGAECGVNPWWQQMVTVGYEQQSGKRKPHERPDGFQISVSRTVNVPLIKLYKAVQNEKNRAQWLKVEGLRVRTAIAKRSMRVTWKDGKSSLEIAFLPKGDNKSQVVVQHSKLPDARSSAAMKAYWRQALDRLREVLE
ncbi:MAG: SRPBCC domain-containing protein [bacterium]